MKIKNSPLIEVEEEYFSFFVLFWHEEKENFDEDKEPPLKEVEE